jgi:hypothetical protein
VRSIKAVQDECSHCQLPRNPERLVAADDECGLVHVDEEILKHELPLLGAELCSIPPSQRGGVRPVIPVESVFCNKPHRTAAGSAFDDFTC